MPHSPAFTAHIPVPLYTKEGPFISIDNRHCFEKYSSVSVCFRSTKTLQHWGISLFNRSGVQGSPDQRHSCTPWRRGVLISALLSGKYFSGCDSAALTGAKVLKFEWCGVFCRAAAAGALAIGSKAAMIMKSGGGVGSLAKVGGLLAAGERICPATCTPFLHPMVSPL